MAMAAELNRHRIEVACPECGHTQVEPALVVSTVCRSCRAQYSVSDGKGIIRKVPVTRFAKPKSAEEMELDELPPVPTAPAIIRRGPAVPPPQSFLMRLLNPAKPPRQLTCFNCSYTYTAAGEAQSSQCPKCSSYVNLLDYEINESWHRSIQTVGNVIIQKQALVTGPTVECHHLTVLGGEVSSLVNCTGNLTIRSHTKMNGSVRCKNLKIEKGVRVEFFQPVIAETAIIGGKVRGQITCSDSLTLEKRSQLQGFVKAASFIVKAGATHTGALEIISS